MCIQIVVVILSNRKFRIGTPHPWERSTRFWSSWQITGLSSGHRNCQPTVPWPTWITFVFTYSRPGSGSGTGTRQVTTRDISQRGIVPECQFVFLHSATSSHYVSVLKWARKIVGILVWFYAVANIKKRSNLFLMSTCSVLFISWNGTDRGRFVRETSRTGRVRLCLYASGRERQNVEKMERERERENIKMKDLTRQNLFSCHRLSCPIAMIVIAPTNRWTKWRLVLIF